MGKSIGIVALKGGVGKTTVVSNLGAILSLEFDKKVLLIDANFSTPHLGMHLGIINPDYNLHHVLEGKYSIYESIYHHPIGVHIIPGKLSPTEIDPLKLREEVNLLRDIYDVILIDSSPSLNNEMVATMAASDEIIVVSSPDYPTLSSTIYAVKVARSRNTPIKGLVVNKAKGKRFEIRKKEIEEALGEKVLATIPDDSRVLLALSKMAPLTSLYPKHKVSKSFRNLAFKISGEKKRKSLFSKLKKKKKPKDESK